MLLAQKIADSDTMIVILTGGEPFLMPNIKEIISLLKSKGKIVKINTNGLTLEKYNSFLIDEQVDSVTVSIDGADANTHDDIRGLTGSYEKALANLKYLKNNRKKGKPFTGVRGVLMKDNFQMMPHYIEQFRNVVDEIHFQPVHNNLAHHQVVDERMTFSESDKQFEKEFSEMMKSVMRNNPEFDDVYYRNFEKFLFHPEQMEELALHSCLAIWMNFFNVAEDGTCYTCSKNIGNLYSSNVDSIWGGEHRINFLRSMAHFGKCKIPCWLNCTGVAPDFVGKGIKSLLKLGVVNEAAARDFAEMPQYTGILQHFTPPTQLEPI